MHVASTRRLSFVLLFLAASTWAKKNPKSLVESVEDHKEFKKLLRTKTNVLVLFSSSEKRSGEAQKVLEEAAQEVKGLATLVTVDCASKEGKKLCKKLKVEAKDSFVLKHYKDGDFNKDYDRAVSLKSMVVFLKDPTGAVPVFIHYISRRIGTLSLARFFSIVDAAESLPPLISPNSLQCMGFTSFWILKK